MGSTNADIAVVSLVTARACYLLGLWIRLRWQARREESQSLDVAAVVESVGADMQLTLDESWSDGHRRHVEITGLGGLKENETS